VQVIKVRQQLSPTFVDPPSAPMHCAALFQSIPAPSPSSTAAGMAATRTSNTMNASWVGLAISQPAAAFCIHVPMSGRSRSRERQTLHGVRIEYRFLCCVCLILGRGRHQVPPVTPRSPFGCDVMLAPRGRASPLGRAADHPGRQPCRRCRRAPYTIPIMARSCPCAPCRAAIPAAPAASQPAPCDPSHTCGRRARC
jgi:hypothetical protein